MKALIALSLFTLTFAASAEEELIRLVVRKGFPATSITFPAQTNLVVRAGETAQILTYKSGGTSLTMRISDFVINESGNPPDPEADDYVAGVSEGDFVMGPAMIELKKTPSSGPNYSAYVVVRLMRSPTVLRATLKHSADGVTWEDAPRGVVAGRENGMFRVTLEPIQ